MVALSCSETCGCSQPHFHLLERTGCQATCTAEHDRHLDFMDCRDYSPAQLREIPQFLELASKDPFRGLLHRFNDTDREWPNSTKLMELGCASFQRHRITEVFHWPDVDSHFGNKEFFLDVFCGRARANVIDDEITYVSFRSFCPQQCGCSHHMCRECPKKCATSYEYDYLNHE